MKRPLALSLAVERGQDGYLLAWCLELAGCAALVAPGQDPVTLASAAIAEFTAWGHQRSAAHAHVESGQVAVAQVLETGAAVAHGETTAFFLHDGLPAGPHEFPGWANAHDQALDEFRELVLSQPEQTLAVLAAGPSQEEIFGGISSRQLALAGHLRKSRSADVRPGVRGLNDAHAWLQQVVCDVDPGLRLRDEAASGRGEEWSVRKVMRRSIWALRYEQAVLRNRINALWTPG